MPFGSLSPPSTLVLFSLATVVAVAPQQNPPEISIGPPQSSAPKASGKSKQQQQQEAAFDVSYAKAVTLRKAHDFEAASKQFQEAEQLAESLTDTKYSWLQEVLAGEAECFMQLKKYDRAEDALLRRKGALQVSPGELDASYPHNISLLADLSARQQNWQSAQEYLEQALKAHERVIAHLASSSGSLGLPTQLRDERRAKAFDQFHLGIIYAREAKYADALVALDESFTAASETKAPASQLTPIATAAKDIAIHTGFPAEVEKWHKRLDSLADSAASKN